MVAIADASPWRTSPLSKLDRPEVLGPLFVAPAIIYVFALVGVPFLLAVYYAVSAYTIYHPSYRFVALRNCSVFQPTFDRSGPLRAAITRVCRVV